MYYVDALNPIVWTGNTSSNWFGITNWEPQQIPLKDDNVKIPDGRPNYPVITTGTASCRKLEIQTGGTLSMTGGTLNVYGEITASDANMFDLNGGTMILNHSSVFPVGMEFNNLTLKSLNNLLSDNTYDFSDVATINGDLKLNGTASGNGADVPNIKMDEGDEISLKKNLIVNQGHIGIDGSLLPLTNNYLIPSLRFTGSASQTMKFNNNVSANIAGLSCDVEIVNPLVKLINTNRDIIFNNLYIFENFNLAGSSIIIAGKVVYLGNEATTKKITNSKPLEGRLSIYNDPAYCADQDFQFIRMDKLRYFEYNGFGLSANDTLYLLKDLTLDTLKVNGYFSMAGSNVTIGSKTTATGFLDCDLISAGIAQGTLSLLGNISHPPYELVAENLNNFILNNPAGVKLNNEFDLPFAHESTGKMELFGNAKLISGSFDMRKSRIFLVESPISSSGNQGRVTETPGNTFRNSEVISGLDAFSISKDTTVVTPVSNLNIGNLGFIITCNNPLNNIHIYRVPEQTAGLNGNSSINRVYFVSNSSGGIGLNATIKLKYDESELIVNESDLAIFRRSMNDPEGVWQLLPSTVNTTTNTVTANSGLSQLDYSSTLPVGFTFYTLASTTFPLRNNDELTNQSELSTTKVLVYPNPFNNNLNAQFNSEIAEAATMQLIDLTGKIIQSETIQLAIGTNDINLCCTEKINAGIYFLRITSSNINSIVKVVKD
ncbi:MAG: T9SS type A sorting domain-containing protein [Bacteroidetes bacterium]|nr:T9SS type A sorting domain-containing protein [Bacteroidota bacterium]